MGNEEMCEVHFVGWEHSNKELFTKTSLGCTWLRHCVAPGIETISECRKRYTDYEDFARSTYLKH